MKTNENKMNIATPEDVDSAESKRKIPKMGIRAHIFMGFTIFVVIIISLLWIFQIALLNSIYRIIRKNEVKSSMNTVVSYIDENRLDDELLTICREKNIEVLISDENGNAKYTKANGQSEIFDYLMASYNNLIAIYNETISNNGELMLTLNPTERQNSYDMLFSSDRHKRTENEEIFIHVKNCKTKNDEDYLIILTAGLTPIESTLTTLKVELWAISLIMILLSAILALLISKRLSSPIEAINSSAKILANGDYGTEFTSSGSKEIAELADTLNYTRKELSKVDSLRKELIANVSHDLRTPLTMIKGFSEVMRDIPGENTPENNQLVIDETERLTSLVNDMLDISKLESGNITLDRSRVNLTDSIKSILHRYDKLADYNFVFNYDREIYVDGDELKLSQVIYNLVNNAITYTGEDKTIIISQTESEGQVTVSISDSGEGIPKDKLPYIWDRYYKVDKAHKRAQRGTGLGLSIVKKIVDLHGGSYGVESTEGEGSVFWFRLNTDDAE